MFDYGLARPNERKLCEYLDETNCTAKQWKEVAESLLGWLSDDDVRRWAEDNGYDIFDEEEEEMKKYTVIVHYEGAFEYTVEAEDEDKAREIAEEKFGCESNDSIAENIADSYVCDSWEE